MNRIIECGDPWVRSSYSESAEITAEHSRRMVESLSSVVENRREFADTGFIFPN